MKSGGCIEAFIGPMFGGKTTTLQKARKDAAFRGEETFFIIPEIDTRYSRDNLNVSHDGTTTFAHRVPINGGGLSLIKEDVLAGTDSIFIDEAHFFPPQELKDFCLKWRARGKHIFIAALSSDSQGKPWPSVQELVPAHCFPVTLCPGICVLCGAFAMYSRKISGDYAQQVDVGGDEKYICTCWAHLTEPATIAPEKLEARRKALSK